MRIIIALILSFFCIDVAAKTSGDYYSYDLYGSQDEEDRSNIDRSAVKSGVEASYKHVIPVGQSLFVAPGVNYQRSSTLTSINQAATTQQQQLSVQNKYGVKFDVGYDVNNYLSPYVTGGMNYGVNAVYNSNAKLTDPLNEALSSTKSGYYYGVGTVTNVNKDLNVGLEYNVQNPRNLGAQNPARVDVYKLNASFKF